MLEVIHPQYTLWESNKTLYPFIFISDSDWSVDVCVYVPQGYKVVEGDCTQVFVANETKDLLFTVVETNSPEPNIKAVLKTKHRGKIRNLDLDIPGIRKNRGVEKASKIEKMNGIPLLATGILLAVTFTNFKIKRIGKKE